MKMMATKERAKTKLEDMCHCLKTIQVSSICVFLRGRYQVGWVDIRRRDTGSEVVRTRAYALNKLDPCPYHHVRRDRDPLLRLKKRG